MRLYEALFLVDNNLARTNYEEIEAHIQGILNRYECETVQSVKWAERKLAFPVKDLAGKEHTRGTYVLVHFNSEPSALIKLDRQFRLSETVIRHLILRDEDGLFDESRRYEEMFEAEDAPDRKTERRQRFDRPRKRSEEAAEVENGDVEAAEGAIEPSEANGISETPETTATDTEA